MWERNLAGDSKLTEDLFMSGLYFAGRGYVNIAAILISYLSANQCHHYCPSLQLCNHMLAHSTWAVSEESEDIT